MTLNPQSVHNSTRNLSSVEIDADQSAKPSAIANALQEAARLHADRLGWGVETLHERKKYWVLSRIHVKWAARPKYAQELTITTWPKGTHSMYALRDFLGSVNGETILKATSSWALLDAQTGRPGSVDELSELFKERANDHAIEEPAERIQIPTEYHKQMEVIPIYTDLDIIGHVNNARYLDWAWSAVSSETRKATTGWTVNYLREVREGEKISLKVGSTEGFEVVVGYSENQKLAFVVAFHLD